MRRAQQPKTVLPENVQVGDTVAVTLPREQDSDMTITHSGKVHRIMFFGNSRRLYTERGHIIFAYDVGGPKIRVTVIDQAPLEHSTLEGLNIAI